MKKTLLILFSMLLCIGAYAQEVTFNFATLYGSSTLSDITSNPQTVSNITASFAKGNSNNPPAYNKAGEIRLYGGKNTSALDGCTMTITSAAGNMSKIILAHGSSCTWGTMTANTGTVEMSDAYDLTWTGDAAEVTFTCSRNASATGTSTQYRFKTATVTLSGTAAKNAAGLNFSETSISIQKDVDEFTAPTFTKATDAAVTFTSDNEDVAKVSTDGVISLAGELGTATITATSPETDNYYAGSTSVKIEVYKYNVYKKVTEITDGKQYLLVAQRNDSTVYAYPVSQSNNYGYLNVGTIKKLTDEISIKSTYDDSFTFTQDDENTYTIKDCYNRYYYYDGTHASFQLGTEYDESYLWTVEAQTDGTFKITKNDHNIQWGSGSYKTFAIYEGINGGAVLPYLYQLVETSSSINNAIIEKAENANAPLYNLAGQQVSKSYKGVVIQNGRKFINK